MRSASTGSVNTCCHAMLPNAMESGAWRSASVYSAVSSLCFDILKLPYMLQPGRARAAQVPTADIIMMLVSFILMNGERG